MNNFTERFRNLKKKTKKRIFFYKIEEKENKKTYYSIIFKHLIKFEITRKGLRITFQKFNDTGGWNFFNLFPIKEDEKFLGIKYGWDNLEKPFFIIGNNNIKYVVKKAYYIEYVFKKGSIKCYVQSLWTLLRKEKKQTKYYKFTLENIKNMEKTVYEFYNKKIKEEGIINKWIEKNQTL
ncbi:hypothetical protein B1U23_06410 (plasmid) [Borreliella burgdorferi]|uniref:Uncharacterized protein n=1 Tax=Borreliella burgdorferi (strain ATCC 35210 / DSM 4680 / CIP 102532 / B31) TaxID=224326 RepID=Q9S008_BORBU|nr:DUF226 domain-containing protein [Borreliella burgdorferi]AAF07710.1 borrelia family of unknown function [Borreliella burgdorferi B31]ACN92262.1 conserved hypothetical protein [Borreliella burgdorferi 94a]ARS30980.1 hypothetical protein B1U23_06410 [Borreliella burgdorferi]ARS32238.1 hypothetical protein B1U22_06545 [Borreliella burgdorferi]ARS32722.1 hypothetical protein B1U21_02445 [Borreliella burgdorferi]